MSDPLADNVARAKAKAIAATVKTVKTKAKTPTYATGAGQPRPRPRTEEDMARTEASSMERLQEYMPFVMVKNGLKAAVDKEAAHLVEQVVKVEFRTKASPSHMSVDVELLIWWELGEGEYHVVTRKETMHDGSTVNPMEILERMTNFQPEDVLKYAAFL